MSNITAPSVISRSHNISNSSTITAISSALTVTQDVVGLVPLVGPQLQSVCELALRLIRGLECLKDIQDDERRLMEKVQDALRIVSDARNDDRSIPMPELKEELHRVYSSLLSVETYLERRLKRSFKQRIVTLISQRDTTNATQCREYVDSALQRFQLVCLIKLRLELDSKMTDMKHVVVGEIKKLGDAVKGFLHPPPYTLQLVQSTSDHVSQAASGSRGGKLEAPSTSNVGRSVTPFHAGRVRSRDEDSDRDDALPSKKARKRSLGRNGRSEDEEGSIPGSDHGSVLRRPDSARKRGLSKETDVSPLPRKRRRSSVNYQQQYGQLGVIDENALESSHMLAETQRPTRVFSSPLVSQNNLAESEGESGEVKRSASVPNSPRTLKRKQVMYFRT
ncbi:hypothetical protein SCHPADRAFT_709035 [Schizopora paradoxa]|uniref:Uncharacterized protein n=1 Tax=Schizopora paradoxa TaxID=27342 RepID=A0A0H2R266_9AGAM|nr:hypothetical protein SCHPADRAFT_709035 [Schizopora paradoxa]